MNQLDQNGAGPVAATGPIAIMWSQLSVSGRTINSAVLLLVIGNLLAILSDTVIKSVSGDIALFQFVALRLVCTIVLLIPLWPLIDRRNLWSGSRIHFVRAHLGLVGVICMVIALGSLPLAVANAIFYFAPVLVLLFGVMFFGERLSRLSVLTVISGLAGVMVILRPDELSLAGLSALGLAVTLALSALLVRKLPKQQAVSHSLMLTSLYALPAALALAWWEGAPLDLSLLKSAFASSFFILGYNVTVILAYRHVDANQVTAAEYTGLVWAFALGWLLFGEIPDLWFYVGAALIVVPLLLHARQPRTTTGRSPAGQPALVINQSKSD